MSVLWKRCVYLRVNMKLRELSRVSSLYNVCPGDQTQVLILLMHIWKICMCVWPCGVCVWCMHACVQDTRGLGFPLCSSLIRPLETLSLTEPCRTGCQQVSAVFLSLSPHSAGVKSKKPCTLLFTWRPGTWTQIIMLGQQVLLTAQRSPQPTSLIL